MFRIRSRIKALDIEQNTIEMAEKIFYIVFIYFLTLYDEIEKHT